MRGWEIAALVAAGAFAVLMLALVVPVLRLRHTIDAATQTLKDVQVRTGPLLDEVHGTVDNVNTALGQVQVTLDGVNVQLARVDTMTQHAQAATANVANLVGVVSAAASSPLVKAAAFSYGFRRANAARRQADDEKAVRATLKAQRKAARGR
ncbi:MAG: DUF948 domain-containing protein [Hamadaea sp.]|uniref:DUF948 domain-containing protein n=1 Tax=Hamadaea sp. TaxID=2024425 RepID=UPI001837E6B4|nr:DUF948 domain-containing protein [Hamadaea sp.]NUR74050.1 DUF948 domain-containing protein [Hamadaea sp.]NUT18260.1 DUF948 domain-containing protein [Hamadaea sp.]